MFEFRVLKVVKVIENKIFSKWIEKNKIFILIMYYYDIDFIGFRLFVVYCYNNW